ncbi:isopenicillin N synthase-like dioxygenase [Endobacter medicaginis]|uniref:Isopenicillin N synthase family oxygenase n=1 Tax=Endobacter medicaginis TaxID=1181271 RepID=A0A839V5B6_9PROT|nr:isopenicillin N synthase family oxygenase [Endobacter medicaginis]MBB3174729.1 isopenicillin N synthase-like dioxygenase [Endobacter medicaginis]MCX5474876.1 isopenicillin N synthase family oxygenase [Endobacter medicaginis]NVN31634.1 isopenicillin N synthase family oxygenase [Endobacter medicaginis]
MDRVPTLDLRRLDTDRDSFVAELGAAYRRFGFCCFSHHGIEAARIEAAYEDFRRFFALPDAVKRGYARGGGRGYVGFKVETAKTSTIPDLKEFWHVGRDGVPADHPRADILTPNVWPDEPAGFRDNALALYATMEAAGQRVLSAMALDLGLGSGFFAPITDMGNSILRALHYPPVRPEDLPAVRAEAHEDISLITLLVGATESGLEILTRDGTWLPIEAQPGVLVVNVGDMMQRLTNHRYPSTTHRVVNPAGEKATASRYSMPFFLAPNMDYLIRTLPGCIDAAHPDLYPEPITAQAYLEERLREIRLA